MRLTEKDYCGYDIKNREDFNGYDNEKDCQKLFSCLQKLGQLEDIEEELGIDLITLIKALKDGVYYLNNQKELHWCQARNLVISQKSLRVYRHHYKLFKEYGKTWALTKEELYESDND